MKPIEKYGKILCPQCKKEVRKLVIKYDKIVEGIFKSGNMITETSYECKHCGWSYTFKEVE